MFRFFLPPSLSVPQFTLLPEMRTTSVLKLSFFRELNFKTTVHIVAVRINNGGIYFLYFFPPRSMVDVVGIFAGNATDSRVTDVIEMSENLESDETKIGFTQTTGIVFIRMAIIVIELVTIIADSAITRFPEQLNTEWPDIAL